jgi:hypothetical protein
MTTRGFSMTTRLTALACVGLLLALFSGCGSPVAGQWRGTVDIGPVAAYPVEIRIDPEATTGRIDLAEAGKPFTRFEFCTIADATTRKLELVYDPQTPACDPKGKPDGRRTLRGTVGEATLFGELFEGPNRIGFFRLFKVDATAPAAKSPTPTAATAPPAAIQAK